MFAKKITTKWIKKADAIVTGLILWWILASVYGIKKYNEAKKPDEKIKKELIDIFDIGWKGNVKARYHSENLDNKYRVRNGYEPVFRAQFETYNYHQNKVGVTNGNV